MDGHDSPVKMPELNVTPETDRGVELDTGMKQVMSLLTAYWHERRVTLQSTPSGVLFVSSSEVGNIFHVLAVTPNHLYQGANIACSEVMVMGHPSNGNTIWVRTKVPATVNNAWPLLKKEVVSFTITNLSLLHIRIVTDTERAIVLYTI